MEYIMQHTVLAIDLYAILAGILLLGIIGYSAVKMRRMKKIRRELEERLEAAERKAMEAPKAEDEEIKAFPARADLTAFPAA